MNAGGQGDIWHVGTNYQWGNTQLVAQGGANHADSAGAALTDRSARSFTVGAIHSLSKRTSLFGGFSRVTQGATGANAAATSPGGPDTSTSTGTYTAGNRDTWTIGMRHNF
jgi:predicted porin